MRHLARLGAVVLLFFCILPAALAQSVPEDFLEEGLACREMEDKVARLLCFDQLFDSPIVRAVPQEAQTLDAATKTGPIRQQVMALEMTRPQDGTGWHMMMRPWQENRLITPEEFEKALSGANPRNWKREQVDVFLTSVDVARREGYSEPPSALLLLSCENDITTLGVLLPKPISTLQANISLSSDNNQALRRLNWRDVENGDVIIAGRGLESIDTIKAITGLGKLSVQVVYPDGPRTFVFEIGALKDLLKPLRAACHW